MMNAGRRGVTALGIVLAAGLGGCATILTGTTDTIPFELCRSFNRAALGNVV